MIAIIDYDAGNIKSVEKALQFLGEEVIVTSDRDAILSADKAILPGVGSFGDAMEKIRERNLEEVIHEFVESGKPFLGICLGMQMALIDYARNVANLAEANSTEFDKDCRNPVIDLMPEQKGVKNLGGTMRIGAYPCLLKKDSLAYDLYAKEEISERHRHRYEVNNDYRDVLENSGLVISGQSPDGHIVEMIELDREEHPYFIATQAHPEFKSRPNHAHPLFEGLIKAVVDLKS